MKVFKGIWRFLVKLFRAEGDLVWLIAGFVICVLMNTLFKIASIYLYYNEGLTPDEFFEILIELIKIDKPELSKKLSKKMIKRIKKIYFWPEPI